VGLEQDLNAPALVVQDLNLAPMDEDSQEVIVHPGQGLNQEEQQQNLPRFVPLQPQQDLVEEVADNLDQIVVQLPALQHPLENFLHHEIPEEDLMDLEIQPPEQNQLVKRMIKSFTRTFN
jgi:hypothetical protein